MINPFFNYIKGNIKLELNFGTILEITIYTMILWMIIHIFISFIQSLEHSNFPKRRSADKPQSHNAETTYGEPFNLLLMVFILIYILILVNQIVGFDLDAGFEPTTFAISAIPLSFICITIIFNVIQNLRGVSKKRRYGFPSETNELTKDDKHKIDLMRKINHLLPPLLIFMVLSLGYNFLIYNRGNPDVIANYWGNLNGLDYISTILVRQQHQPFARSLILLTMYGQAIFVTGFETTRLSKKVHFPFHKANQKILRYKEIDTFSASSHFALGYLFAAATLPPILFLASLCLIVFADPISSTIGMKYGGKFMKRFSWNKKSIEGLIAGSFLAFITMIWFAGPIYAIAGAITFAVVDLVTPKPFNISDNILFPISIVFVFWALSIAGIPCQNFLGFA